MAPVLPWLTDGEDALDAALGRIAAAGAQGVVVVALHLRPGAREWFFTWLRRTHPTLVSRYEGLYAGRAYVPDWYARSLRRRVGPLLARHGLGSPFRPSVRPPGRGSGSVTVAQEAEGEFPAGSMPVAAAEGVPSRPAGGAGGSFGGDQQLSLL
jgi:hypothetical protein